MLALALHEANPGHHLYFSEIKHNAGETEKHSIWIIERPKYFPAYRDWYTLVFSRQIMCRCFPSLQCTFSTNYAPIFPVNWVQLYFQSSLHHSRQRLIWSASLLHTHSADFRPVGMYIHMYLLCTYLPIYGEGGSHCPERGPTYVRGIQ